MKVVVTGALGHIGSRLIRELPEAVDVVILVDNLTTQRYASLFNLPVNRRYRFVEADVCTSDLSAYIAGARVVIHLAALTSAEESQREPARYMQVNVDGLKQVAEACLRQGVPLFFPSTTSVCGGALGRIDETSALGPQSPYAETKMLAERALAEMGMQGLRYVVCRFGTIFGPSAGMRFHTAVNRFVWQAASGQALTVWRTAWQQSRPYLDLGDCVAAVNCILERDMFNGEIYNVLTGNFTVEQIVGAIRTVLPDVRVDLVESPIMTELSYEVDDSKIRAAGFVPRGDLREGIEATLRQLSGIVEHRVAEVVSKVW